MYTDFKNMCIWLNFQGVSTQNNRFSLYRKIIEGYLLSDTLVDAMKGRHVELPQIFSEITELLWIYESFRHRVPKGAIDLFHKVISGRELTFDDINSSSRDFQLQLKIAGYFNIASDNVGLEDECDVKVEVEGFTYFVECKRISSNKKINKNTKKAAKQLDYNLNVRNISENCYGVAVVDVTQMIFPTIKDLVVEGSCEKACIVFEARFEELIGRYDFISPFLHNRRIICIWIVVNAPLIHPLSLIYPLNFTCSKMFFTFPAQAGLSKPCRTFRNMIKVSSERLSFENNGFNPDVLLPDHMKEFSNYLKKSKSSDSG